MWRRIRMNILTVFQEMCLAGFVSLSFGGLIQPSEEFLEHVQLMEKIFCKHTRNHFTGIRQINVKLLQKLSKKCTVDDVIMKTLVRQCIFIKINFLNVELQQQKINYSERKRADRQASNKFKKITM
jgi:hypothetical protein